MTIKDLTNEEILLIFYRFSGFIEKTESAFENKKIASPIDTPYGQGSIFKIISDEDISKLKCSDNYVLSKALVEKLKPIIEVIEEHPEYKEYSDKLK